MPNKTLLLQNRISINQIQLNLAIRSKRILTPEGFVDGTIFISEGKIIAIETIDNSFQSEKTIDASNNVVMPGIIDPHVHINEPGRTDWEGFDTAMRSAAAGGITTLIDMPLNSTPVTTSLANLRLKIVAARKKAHVNCGFWGRHRAGQPEQSRRIAGRRRVRTEGLSHTFGN